MFKSATMLLAAVTFAATILPPVVVFSSEATVSWKRTDRALVIDAYEYNPINWNELTKEKRITGFINKASDGLPPAYRCVETDKTERRLCRALWRRYAVTKELYHTRKMIAKSKGLLWGAYHLGRPGNPIDQANHFIDFTDPQPDDLIALDIEDNNPDKWLSLADAEIFAQHIKTRLGRYPVLYTNGSTAKFIAQNRHRYKILSRLPLWYARYRPKVSQFFPKGNWENYALWQFVSQVNCKRYRCPYRPPGTPKDIDVNVAAMSPENLRKTWPFTRLHDMIVPDGNPIDSPLYVAGAKPQAAKPQANEQIIAQLPTPMSRKQGLKRRFKTRLVSVVQAPLIERLALSYHLQGPRIIPAKPSSNLAQRDIKTKAQNLTRMASLYSQSGNQWPNGRQMDKRPMELNILTGRDLLAKAFSSPFGVDMVVTSAVSAKPNLRICSFEPRVGESQLKPQNFSAYIGKTFIP